MPKESEYQIIDLPASSENDNHSWLSWFYNLYIPYARLKISTNLSLGCLEEGEVLKSFVDLSKSSNLFEGVGDSSLEINDPYYDLSSSMLNAFELLEEKKDRLNSNQQRLFEERAKELLKKPEIFLPALLNSISITGEESDGWETSPDVEVDNLNGENEKKEFAKIIDDYDPNNENLSGQAKALQNTLALNEDLKAKRDVNEEIAKRKKRERSEELAEKKKLWPKFHGYIPPSEDVKAEIIGKSLFVFEELKEKYFKEESGPESKKEAVKGIDLNEFEARRSVINQMLGQRQGKESSDDSNKKPVISLEGGGFRKLQEKLEGKIPIRPKKIENILEKKPVSLSEKTKVDRCISR